jgi:hypothetical protein
MYCRSAHAQPTAKRTLDLLIEQQRRSCQQMTRVRGGPQCLLAAHFFNQMSMRGVVSLQGKHAGEVMIWERMLLPSPLLPLPYPALV